ncbi:DNA replication/repair protein RecF [Thalassotalea aquiviva]|uniref:DNA replication/repair protein RecF n=1 Tax=Thalassotalea aquiviva TaxID=3242415 RepID=UPI00352B1A9D
MSIQSLTTNYFRNLAYANIKFDRQLNFIIGNNGSGKSSLLESIFFLGHGKSFRTSKTDNLIANGQDNFVVSVKDDRGFQLGVKRSKGQQLEIKINGDSKFRLSDLAKNIAVQVITPETFRLFFGGPKERRRFIDLGMFHVEHSFSEMWRHFRKVLLHRNACLKNRISGQQFDYWNQQFCLYSEQIAQARSKYVGELAAEVQQWLTILLPSLNDEIQLQYHQGWNSKRNLAELLHDNADKERAYGHSLFGAHKFDVRFNYQKMNIEQTLSRGQQKLFLMALTIAQANLIFKQQQVSPIILIDDIGAELDIHSRQALANAIAQLDCQLFITAIDQSALDPLMTEHKNYQMFHVEHGVVKSDS